MENPSLIRQPETLYEASERKYQEYALEYAPLFKSKSAGDIEFDSQSFVVEDKTHQKLLKLAQPFQESVVAFADRIASRVPQEIFEDVNLIPTSRMHLAALVAAEYVNRQPEDISSAEQEMYIRALSALKLANTSFSNNYTEGTDEVIEKFMGTDFGRNDTYNFFISLLTHTMPFSDYKDQSEKYLKYRGFMEKLKRETTVYKAVLRKHIEKTYPGREVPSANDDYPVAYVESIKRTPSITNDQFISERKKYGALSAGAITAGIDTVTNLPLIMHKLPFDFDKIADDQEPGKKIIFNEANTLIHEAIHNVTEHEALGDWHLIVNELLTDSAARIIFLASHGQPFDTYDEKFEISDGYRILVNLARNLVARDVIKEAEILKFGLAQDPAGFLNLLDQRMRDTDPKTIRSLVEVMMANRVILPLKRDEIPAKVEEFIENPVATLQQEVTEAWNRLGGAYLGQPWWIVEAIEKLEKDPKYVENIKRRYREVDPNIEVTPGMIIRDPIDKMFTDEAIDILRQTAGKKERFTKRYAYFNNIPELEEYLDKHINEIDLSDTLKGFESSSEVRDFVMATNNALGHGLTSEEPGKDPAWPTVVRKIPILLDATKVLYQTINDVLKNNWTAHKINYTNDDILQMIDQVIPGWFDWDNQGPKTVDELASIVKERVNILTSPYTPDQDGPTVIPDIETVLHWGPGIG